MQLKKRSQEVFTERTTDGPQLECYSYGRQGHSRSFLMQRSFMFINKYNRCCYSYIPDKRREKHFLCPIPWVQKCWQEPQQQFTEEQCPCPSKTSSSTAWAVEEGHLAPVFSSSAAITTNCHLSGCLKLWLWHTAALLDAVTGSSLGTAWAAGSGAGSLPLGQDSSQATQSFCGHKIGKKLIFIQTINCNLVFQSSVESSARSQNWDGSGFL